MTKAKARILARCVYRGSKAIDDIPAEYRDAVREEYYLLFGEELV